MKWHSLSVDEIAIIINLHLSGRSSKHIASLLGVLETQIAWILSKKSGERFCQRECKEIKRRLDFFIGGDKNEPISNS